MNHEFGGKNLIETIIGIQELKIEIWDVDFQHALDGHPEVTLEKIRTTLTNPFKVVQSKRSNNVCLFYNLEIQNDNNFGTIYFCVVVGVMKNGIGKMETAYETTYIKSDPVLFDKATRG